MFKRFALFALDSGAATTTATPAPAAAPAAAAPTESTIIKGLDDLNARILNVTNAVKAVEDMQVKGLINNSFLHIGGRSGSMESTVMKSMGLSHVKQLMEVNCGTRFKSEISDDARAQVYALKRDILAARWIAQMFYGDNLDRGDLSDDKSNAFVKSIFDTAFAKSVDLRARVKAFGSTVVGGGDEWVPTNIPAMYIEEFELERKVQGLFRELPMSSNPWQLPVQKNRTTARKAGEGASVTGSNFGTDKIQFDAIKSFELFNMPEELNEDSAPAIIDLGRMEIIEAQHRAIETADINGDTTATHQDADTHALGSDVAEKFYPGLRKRALANSANGGTVTFSSAVTTAKLDQMRKQMGKFGVNVRQLALLFSSSGYNQAQSLPEVSTVEKFGPQATILNGALAAFRGIPVIVSEYMRDGLNASGVQDGITTDNTVVLLVNTSRFMHGRRRPIKTKVQMDARAENDQWQLASYQRLAFNGFTQSASEVSVVAGIDVTM